MVQISQHLGDIRTLMMQMESVLEMLFDLYQLTQLLAEEDIIQFCCYESFNIYMEAVCFLKMSLSTYQTSQCDYHHHQA
jgi:hypothetical protein